MQVTPCKNYDKYQGKREPKSKCCAWCWHRWHKNQTQMMYAKMVASGKKRPVQELKDGKPMSYKKLSKTFLDMAKKVRTMGKKLAGNN